MHRLWAVTAVLLVAVSLHAQTTFTLQEEDDSLVSAALRADRGYTNGTRMLWTWTPAADSHLDRIAKVLCHHDLLCARSVTAGLGQNMYTPDYLLSRFPIRGDRPYGGWLYGTLMLDATRAAINDHVELYAGVIGRDSHAADAQIFVHKHVTPGAPDPLGWDTQIGEWAAFLASYDRRVKLVERSGDDGRLQWFDVTPALGAAAGNVFVNASASTTVRLGYNLPSHFIEPIRAVPLSLRTPPGETERLATRMNQSHPITAQPDWDAFVYVILNASYVARNVFIDSEDDKYRIERRPWQREHRAGISFRVRHFRLAYQYTRRSSEFRSLVPHPPSSSSPHSYGMVMISIGPNP